MKRFAGVFLMVLVLGTAVFAEGTREAGSAFDGGDLTSLSGILDLSGNQPVLVSGGEEYFVMLPRIYGDDIDIKDGTQLTLKGYVHTGYGRYVDTDQQVIRVTEAVVNGETYNFDTFGRGYAAAGSGTAPGARNGMNGGGRGAMGGARSAWRR